MKDSIVNSVGNERVLGIIEDVGNNSFWLYHTMVLLLKDPILGIPFTTALASDGGRNLISSLASTAPINSLIFSTNPITPDTISIDFSLFTLSTPQI